MTYEVTLITTIKRTYTIDADSEQDAIEEVVNNQDEYEHDEDTEEEVEVLDIEDYA